MGLFSRKKKTTASNASSTSGGSRCTQCGGQLSFEKFTDDAYVDCKACGTEMRIAGKLCLCGNCGIYQMPNPRKLTCPKCGQTYDLPEIMPMGSVRESH